MRVNVVDLLAPGEPDVSVYDGPCEACPYDNVLYVPVPATVAPADLPTLLNDIDPTLRAAADCAVLRLHGPHDRLLLADEAGVLDRIWRRLERRRTAVLRWADDQHMLTPIGDGPDGLEGAEQLLPALRQAEVDHLLQAPGVVLPKASTIHYEGPNGKHYESFVRVGTAMQSVDAIDGVTFWMLPELADRPVLLLDSWTIISLGLNARRYGNDAEIGDRAAVAVECQRHYDEHRTTLIPRLRTLHARHNDAPIVILISVSSSGSLAGDLEAACRAAGFTDVRVICLVAPRAEPNVFCRFDAIGTYHDRSACPWCQPGTATHSPSVRIEPTTYLLELEASVEESRITRTHALGANEFFEDYGGVGCFSIHRDEPFGSNRHHMISLDAERLTSNAKFKVKLHAVLAGMPPPDVVLAPAHPAAADLARQVSQFFGHDDPIIADAEELPALEPERRRLKDAARVLLVDDVVITANRLRSYRQYLRELGLLSVDHPNKLNFLVAVARPPSTDVLQTVIEMVHGSDQYWEVERLLLPHWGADKCPWCWEAERLEAVRDRIESDRVLADRHDRLVRGRHGVHGDLFLRWATNEPESAMFTLGPGSVFHANEQVELFVSVAHALQVLRTARKLTERLTVPLARVLSPYYVQNRYYDAIIYACILRAAQPHDLRARAVEDTLVAMIRDRLAAKADQGLRGEILLAMSRGVLPMLPEVLAPDGVLSELSGTAQVRALLRSALEH